MAGIQHHHFVAADEKLQSLAAEATEDLYNGRQASLKLDIIIVGCGLGGLAAAHCLAKAGHKIRIVEQAPSIGEVGAGIQVSPNVSRLLIRWGLGDALKRVAVEPEALVFRRYADGKKVGFTRWDTMRATYDAPYYHIHRADFHKMLLDLATPSMELHLNSLVTQVTLTPASSSPTGQARPVVHLADGKSLEADLLIGADGVKSLIRTFVLNSTEADKPRPTGDAAYRAVIPTSLLLEHEDLRPLVEHPEMTGWMGPGRHIMGYCIRGGEEYNLVLLHPDTPTTKDGRPVESWTLEGSADKMREEFADFEPRIRKLLSFVPTTLKWTLMDRDPLGKWVHESGRVVLMGDACHPMLPYRAQGAAMAVEDAAVLGNLFSRLDSYAQITPLLNAYFDLRYPRTTATQLSSRLNQKIFHLEDGPEQEKRDRDMEEAMKNELATLSSSSSSSSNSSPSSSNHSPTQSVISLASSVPSSITLTETDGGFRDNPNQWADKEKSLKQFGYDADRIVDEWWDREGREYVKKEAVKATLEAKAVVALEAVAAKAANGNGKAWLDKENVGVVLGMVAE